ncbi:MAG: nitroreductase [Rubrimonas sp.]
MTLPLTPRPEVLDFLLTRRSRPAKTLAEPGPGRTELETLLRAAARTPDHGKLEPWRFVVLGRQARVLITAAVRARGAELDLDPDAIEKAAGAFGQGPVIVAVVASPKASEKIPEWEQLMSAGAVCLSLLNAALAAGWGANWLSGWPARDRETLAAIEIAEPEFVAGFIHIGTETVAPPDRPRPDVAAITRWLD